MAYAREDIDKVRERTDLAELAAEVTKVKRTGRSVMAVCPFHQEKTPSLSIDPDRGLFHCFGCGKSGDVFSWVQETEGLDFVGSLELLARRAGVTLTEDPGAAKRRGRREELVAATAAAVDFYHERLVSAEDAGPARAYLRSRGYDGEVAAQFHLGFSPPDWDVLVRHLIGRKFSEAVIERAGLGQMSRRNRLIDRFRGRLMFPIYDLRGDPVGFGARRLDGDGPKYLNSPETPIYHKSRLLYGLNWAKSKIVTESQAVVVEGYTDVIACHLAGMPVAVATCGTALGEDHLDLLRRFTERVVLAFDADEAGAGAALRGFEHAVPGDLDLRVANLPVGRDPADLVAAGEVPSLRKAVAESTPLLQFRIERELARYDLTEAEARGKAVRAAAALVALHPDELVRHEYAVMLSRRTGVDLDVVERAIRQGAAGQARRGAPTAVTDERPLTGTEKAERELLRVMLANHPALRTLAGSADELADLLTRADHSAAWKAVAPSIWELPAGEAPDLGRLTSGLDPDVAHLIQRVALTRRPLPDPGSVVKRLKLAQVESRIDEVRAALGSLDPDADPREYSTRLEELIALERRRRQMRSHGSQE